jgi:hypothetical protein
MTSLSGGRSSFDIPEKDTKAPRDCSRFHSMVKGNTADPKEHAFSCLDTRTTNHLPVRMRVRSDGRPTTHVFLFRPHPLTVLRPPPAPG